MSDIRNLDLGSTNKALHVEVKGLLASIVICVGRFTA